MQVTLIRNAKTKSNNINDPPLSREGIALLKSKTYPEVCRVYSSMEKKCLQTAGIIYPQMPVIIEEGFYPFSVGNFENIKWSELTEDEEFIKWANSKYFKSITKEESIEKYFSKIFACFKDIVNENLEKNVESFSIITHRIIIVSILKRFSYPDSYYKFWDIKHGGGCTFDWNESLSKINITKEF